IAGAVANGNERRGKRRIAGESCATRGNPAARRTRIERTGVERDCDARGRGNRSRVCVLRGGDRAAGSARKGFVLAGSGEGSKGTGAAQTDGEERPKRGRQGTSELCVVRESRADCGG